MATLISIHQGNSEKKIEDLSSEDYKHIMHQYVTKKKNHDTLKIQSTKNKHNDKKDFKELNKNETDKQKIINY